MALHRVITNIHLTSTPNCQIKIPASLARHLRSNQQNKGWGVGREVPLVVYPMSPNPLQLRMYCLTRFSRN